MSEDRDDVDVDDLDQADPPEVDEDLDVNDQDDDLPPEDLDEDADEGEPVEAEPARQPTRGQNRVAALASENARLKRELEEKNARDADAQRQRNAEAFQRQEAERLEQMTPDERVDYRVRQAVAPLQFQTWDTNDRVTFDGLVSRNSAVAAIKDDVEQVFQDRVRQGAAVDRTTIAKYLIGERALAKVPKAKAAGARAAAAGRERNQVRPSSGRGDAAPAGRTRMNEQEARRKRLEDVTF